MSIQQINDKATEILFTNGLDYLDRALSMLFSDNDSAKKVKFAVVDFQMACELFIKQSLVKNHGLGRISHKPINISSDLNSINTHGYIKVIQYEKCKNMFIKEHNLDQYRIDLLQTFQETRNALVHFGKYVNQREFTSLCGHIMASIFRPMFSERSDSRLSRYISMANYKKLLAFKPYVDDSIDTAYEYSDQVYHCFECRNDTLGLIVDSYHCYCCGMTSHEIAIDYIACPFCKTRTYVIDRLNSTNGFKLGGCTMCLKRSFVSFCPICNQPGFTEISSKPMPVVCSKCGKQHP